MPATQKLPTAKARQSTAATTLSLPAAQAYQISSIVWAGFATILNRLNTGFTRWPPLPTQHNACAGDIGWILVGARAALIGARSEYPDVGVTGQPIGSPSHGVIVEWCLGNIIKQPESDPYTCVFAACTVAVGAMYQLKFHKTHPGAAGFEALLAACKAEKGIFVEGKGADVEGVLRMMKRLKLLPLDSWKPYKKPSKEVVLDKLKRGPCVGVIRMCRCYSLSRDQNLVNEGSPRCYGRDDNAQLHAVVCFACGVWGERMLVRVLDNQNDEGPKLWIDVRELCMLYTFTVKEY